MESVDRNAAFAFGELVRRFVNVVEGEASGVDLLRQLRVALADIYAMALHQPERAAHSGPGHYIDLVPDAKKDEVVAALERRMPAEIYWSGLLPRTWADVEDLGVKTLADALGTIYGWLAPGLPVLDTVGDVSELRDWWFEWEAQWGRTAARCIAILHEVIGDLEMYRGSTEST